MFRHSFHSTILLAALFIPRAYPQNADSAPKRALITQGVDNEKRVTLIGNTRAAANSANDRGRVADSLPLEHMLLQLQRPPEMEQALEQYEKDLQDPSSPSYHQWLTAAQFGEKFGLAQSDLDAITNWLESEGFLVNRIYLNKITVDFSGTAGQVARAFRTEIHNLEVNGERHIANMGDPQIPELSLPLWSASLRSMTSGHMPCGKINPSSPSIRISDRLSPWFRAT